MSLFLSPMDKMLFDIAELKRCAGMTGGPRMGTISDVKEAGGERKVRVVYGVKGTSGEPLKSCWMHCDDHSSGGEREQQLYKKGQNVTISCQGNDFRQARVSPYAQSKSAPQPDFAQNTSGRSHQRGNIGIRMHGPDDDQGGGGSGGGGSGGGGGGSGGGSGEGHIYDTFMFEAEKPPAHQDQPSQPLGGGGGSGGGEGAGGQQQQGQQGQKKKVEPTIISRIHEKDKSVTHYIKEGKNRSHTNDKGAEISANDGKTYGTAFTDGIFQVVAEKQAQVNLPWRIKKKQGLKKTDVAISGGGGGGGGGG